MNKNRYIVVQEPGRSTPGRAYALKSDHTYDEHLPLSLTELVREANRIAVLEAENKALREALHQARHGTSVTAEQKAADDLPRIMATQERPQ